MYTSELISKDSNGKWIRAKYNGEYLPSYEISQCDIGEHRCTRVLPTFPATVPFNLPASRFPQNAAHTPPVTGIRTLLRKGESLGHPQDFGLPFIRQPVKISRQP
jgi:hypothetical protein